VRKPERKRPLGTPRHRWVDNIKIDFGEIRLDGMDWIVLAQDRDKWRALVNAVIKFRVPTMLELLSGCTTDGLSRKTEIHGVACLVAWLVGWLVSLFVVLLPGLVSNITSIVMLHFILDARYLNLHISAPNGKMKASD
jgi:hypothetical protein